MSFGRGGRFERQGSRTALSFIARTTINSFRTDSVHINPTSSCMNSPSCTNDFQGPGCMHACVQHAGMQGRKEGSTGGRSQGPEGKLVCKLRDMLCTAACMHMLLGEPCRLLGLPGTPTVGASYGFATGIPVCVYFYFSGGLR